MLKNALLILCCAGILHGAGQPDSSSVPASLPANQVFTDGSMLLLGAWNAGFGHIFGQRFGLFGQAAAGTMAFAEITAWYQLQARYYLVNRPAKGMFSFLSARHTGLEYNGAKARATAFAAGIGFSWISWRRLLLEASFALSVSPDSKTTFQEFDGYANRRVSVGGIATPWGMGIGFVF